MSIERVGALLMEMTEDEVDQLCAWLDRRGYSLLDKIWDGTSEAAVIRGELHGGTDRLRRIASESPKWAYEYAIYVDQSPHDVTRKGACASPGVAYQYARDVDKGPREETRAAACGNANDAYMYAWHVDKAPRDDTRAAASRDAYRAYSYAENVDKGPHPVTRAVASKVSAEFRSRYIEAFGSPKEEEV